MARWLVAIAAASFTALGAWLTILNPEIVHLRLTPAVVFERPLSQILLAAFALGAAVVTLLTSTRGIGRAWQRARQRRHVQAAVDEIYHLGRRVAEQPRHHCRVDAALLQPRG